MNETPGEKAALPFRLLTPADIEALPDIEYLIAGILPTSSFGILYGQPEAGKSFIALSMAIAIAGGEVWLGRTTRQGRVLYVAAEGAGGMKNRLRACRTRGRIEDANLCFIGVPFAARDTVQVDGLLTCLDGFKPDLIIVDTLARVAVGADENSARDMGQIVEGFEALKRATGATVLVVHHTRVDGDRERGSSALRGAADVMISCEEAEGDGCKGAKISCEKMKDDEPFKTFSVRLEKIELGDGKSSSLVVAGLLNTRTSQASHGHKILTVLRDQFGAEGATHGELKEAFIGNSNLSESTFNRALSNLKESGLIKEEGSGKGKRYTAVPDDGGRGRIEVTQALDAFRRA